MRGTGFGNAADPQRDKTRLFCAGLCPNRIGQRTEDFLQFFTPGGMDLIEIGVAGINMTEMRHFKRIGLVDQHVER